MVSKQIRYPNLSDFPRTEVAYTTVPFSHGEWDGISPLVLKDVSDNEVDFHLEPFGKRWPDGSVRYARLLARVELAEWQTRVHRLIDGAQTKTLGFRYHPAVFAATGANAPGIGIKVDGQWMWSQFSENLTMLENNRLRQVLRSRHRLGNFVVDMKYYVASRQQLVKFELAITGSNPDNTLLSYPFEEIRLVLPGGKNYANIRAAQRRAVSAVDPYKDFRLMANDAFGDGQKQVWYGEIMPDLNLGDMLQVSNALAAVNFPLYGMSVNWRETKAFGIFGAIPQPESSFVWQQASEIHGRFARFMNTPGDPWDDYLLGVTKTPGQTGGQRDFGCLEGAEVLHAGIAELLDAYLFMATEETKRPGHYYEADGSPVRSANHPNWVTWNGATHWHTGVSPDRLGKTLPDFGGNHHGWVGKDWQHHSSNLLSLASLLTGSYMLLDEVDMEVENFLAGHTLPSVKPGWSTNGRREARGFGRPHHALANHYLLTGREDIKTRMMARFVECIVNEWDGATRSPVRNWSHIRDDRVLGSDTDAWVAWNESLGLVGMVALYNLTKNDAVKNLMVAWANTIIRYGYRATRSGSVLTDLEIAQGVRWFEDGRALTEQEYLDPTMFKPAGGLILWSMPVLQVVSSYPNIFGESLANLAMEYRTFMETEHTINPAEPFSEFGRWKAIDIV